MDFSLREWLLVLGIVVILGVLLDGFRRTRQGRRGSLKLSIDKKTKVRNNSEVDYFNGELPNGGARVVGSEAADEGPLFTGTVENIESAPPISSDPMPESLFVDENEVEAIATGSVLTGANKTETVEVAVQDKAVEAAEPKVCEKRNDVPVLNGGAEGALPQEVIVINVFAKDDKQFNGSELMQVILPCGMRYGHLDIFHRTEGKKGEGRVQFSMANAVTPGSFDLDTMDSFHTPGVSFFLSLPGPKNNMKAFDYMLETARCVAKNLDGEIKDGQHSDLTSQTIGHSRQIIRDFERRQLSLLR